MSWMRLEVNYLRHPKFLVLSPEAICLWHECKSYCEEHLTDGVITAAAMKSFRFYGRKRVQELVTSAGLKHPFQEDYKPFATVVEKELQTLSDDQMTVRFAPLLEIVEGLGYRLHDYLSYNRSRQSSLERIAEFQEQKDKNRDRQRTWRASRKAFLAVHQDAPRHVLDNALPNGKVCSIEEKRSEVDQKDLSLEQRAPVLILPPTALVSDALAARGGRLVERFGELVLVHRHGAHYRARPNLDWMDACDLCQHWTDERLDKLIVLVLTTDDPFISSTDRSFKIFAMKASWADDRLCAWEAEQGIRS